MPAPKGRSGKTFSAYLIAQLFHAGTDLEWRSKTVKTQHTEGEGADVMWQSKFEWEYDIDDMAFLRFVYYYYYILSFFPADFFFPEKRFTIWHNVFAARDDHIVVFCARLNHIVKDKWSLVRMMDMKGKNSGATVLVRFSTLQVQ